MIRALLRISLALALLSAGPAVAQIEKDDFLTDAEEEKLREAQDPSGRIEVYLGLTQARLDLFDDSQKKSPDPSVNTGADLDSLLDQYVTLNEELKNWIEYQYNRQGDMRHGLRSVLERGARQLEQLRRIQQSPGAYSSDYKDTLRDAIEELGDTLDGATKALAGQEKKFAEMKRAQKVEERGTAERRKEEEKRNKQEKKLRKKEQKQQRHGVPEED